MAAFGATLKASVEDIKKSSTKFGTLANDTKKLTDRMMQLVENSKSVWQGEAQNAYWKKFDSLRGDMQKIFKMIDEYRSDLTEIARNYESAENANKSAAAALKSNIISG